MARKELIEKTPPQCIDAELWIIGAMMAFKNAIPRALNFLTGADFYHKGHGLIFEAIRTAHDAGHGVFFTTVIDALGNNLEAAGGREFIIDLVGTVATPDGLKWHCDKVKEASRLRAIIATATQTAHAAFEIGADPSIISAATVASLVLLAPKTKQETGDPSVLGAWYHNRLTERYENAQRTDYMITSGWRHMDSSVNIQRGDLAIIAGRPGMAKSSFAVSLAWNIAKYAPALFFSLEMARDRILDRLALSMTTIGSKALERAELNEIDWMQVQQVADAVQESGLHLYSQPDLTVEQVKRRVQQMIGDGKPPAAVFIDYLGLMKFPKADRHDLAIGEVTRALKVMAGELDTAVFLLTQLSRDVEKRTNKRPFMSDIKDSGSIEADADLVFLLYRDDYYAVQERRESKKQGICEVDVAKYRNGSTTILEFDFDAGRQTFREPQRDW